MRNQRQGVRSTKKVKAPATESSPVEKDKNTAAKTPEAPPPPVEKIKDIFLYVYDPRDTLCTDQTGKFGQGCGNNHQVVGVDIESNSIWAKPV